MDILHIYDAKYEQLTVFPMMDVCGLIEGWLAFCVVVRPVLFFSRGFFELVIKSTILKWYQTLGIGTLHQFWGRHEFGVLYCFFNLLWGAAVNVKLDKWPRVLCLSLIIVLYSLWPSLCSRSQIKYQQSDAINKDMTGLKSWTAVRGLLNVISYGTETKADAVLSYWQLFEKKMASVTAFGKQRRWWTLTQKKAYKSVILELSVKHLNMLHKIINIG